MKKNSSGGTDDEVTSNRRSSRTLKRRRVADEDNVIGSDDQVEERLEPILKDIGQDNCDRSVPLLLTDPDVLHCPICFNSLSIRLYDCGKGHITCYTCYINLGKKCASCSKPLKRCRAFEKMLKSIKLSCSNAKYGCKETLFYREKNDHESKCIHGPCFCPHSGCDFFGTSEELSIHFIKEHRDFAQPFLYGESFDVSISPQVDTVILQEEISGNLFVVNRQRENLGHAVLICRIGPYSEPEHSCNIITGRTLCAMVFQSHAKIIQRCSEGSPSSGPFFFVPYYCFVEDECVMLRITIE